MNGKYRMVNDLEAFSIIKELKEYLKDHGLQFYKIGEEFKGSDKYITFSVTIKVDSNV